MGVKVQTRYSTTYTTAMADVQTTMDVAAAPANNIGYLTIRRNQSDQEDTKYTGVSGLQLTGMLRGLSPTALTDTEVIGLKKSHVLNSPSSANTVEMTTLHYIINNKPNKDDNEQITGTWQFLGGSTVFFVAPSVSGLKDSLGTNAVVIIPNASAVNYLQVAHANTGSPVIFTVTGSDTNVSGEFQAKGTGIFTFPDGSQLKTNAAPTDPKGIANKKYVDDQILASTAGNASTIQKGVVEEATDPEVGAGTGAGATGARLFINPGSTTVSTRTPNKCVVTNSNSKIDPNIYDPDRLFAPLESILGENVSASDITNNLNLMYQNPTDKKWYKISTTVSTWYHRLALCMDSGVTNDTGKRLLLKGRYTGKSFANINPTFSNGSGGNANPVGQTSGTCAATWKIDNSSGAEATVTGGTISARQVGTPSGNLNVYLVLENPDSPNKPAAFFESTNNIMHGAIIASASISQALFSGVYQNLSFSFGSVKIPAGSSVYLCVSKGGAVNGSNYYDIESSSGFLATYDYGSNSWFTPSAIAKYTLTVTSTSPVGYGVKICDVSGSSGSFGLTPINTWGRVIGDVISASEMYFDPEQKRESLDTGGFVVTPTTGNGILTKTINFCPSQVRVVMGSLNSATSPISRLQHGSVRGLSQTGVQYFEGAGNGGINADNFLAVNGTLIGLNNPSGLAVNNAQNALRCIRLENGYHVYNGYGSGNNFIHNGNSSGFNGLYVTFEFEAKI